MCIVTANLIAQQEKEEENAASNATNPLAFVTKLQFQPNYNFLDGGGDQLSLVSRIIQPTGSIGLPFIKSNDPSKVYTIYRLEFPLISQTLSDSANTGNGTGISDIALLDVISFKQSWGIIGVGPALLMPTASPDIFGSGKWSAGLAGVVLYTKTKGLQIGGLAQQYISFAGSENKEDVNFMLLQPIFNLILGKGVFFQFSPIMKLDWQNSEYSIPVGPTIGKAFAKNLSLSIGTEYLVSGPSKGDFVSSLT